MPSIYLICGMAASGKSTHIKNHFATNHVYLSRDEQGGKVINLLPQALQAVKSGKDAVIDCTFITKASRAPFIAIAKKNGIDIHSHQMSTTIEEAQFNACWRIVNKYGEILRADQIKKIKDDPHAFPPGVLFKTRNDFEPITPQEGFTSVTIIDNKWKLPKNYKNKALLLDYDGTLRECIGGNGKYPTDKKHIKLREKVSQVLDKYKNDGYGLLGVSNQSGVSKGDFTFDACSELFRHTNKLIGHDIEFMFDTSRGGPINSWLRKPMPGMGVHFIVRHKLNPAKCIMVGDMTTDRTFAERCGFQFQWANDFFKG